MALNGEHKNLHGCTIVCPALAAFIVTLVDVTLPELTVGEIPDEDLSSDFERSVPQKIANPGELSATIRYIPSKETNIPVGEDEQDYRIVLPLLAGETVAAYYTFTGWIKSMGRPKATNTDRATTTLTWKCNTDLVLTPAT